MKYFENGENILSLKKNCQVEDILPVGMHLVYVKGQIQENFSDFESRTFKKIGRSSRPNRHCSKNAMEGRVGQDWV